MRSALNISNDSLLVPLLLSVAGHGGMIGGFALFTALMAFCGDSKPIIDIDDTMQVSMVELSKSKSKMPDRATRAPEPVGKPEPTPVPVPPPDVKHTSDLAVKVETAAPKPGVETKRLEDAMKQLERQQKLADMEAALGTLNQAATDPNSTTDDGALSGNVGTPSDPEYARYINELRKVFLAEFHPLQSVRDANPNIVCKVRVMIDPVTAKVLSYEIARSSGVAVFDAAAERAVSAVEQVPVPPDKYKNLMSEPYLIEFK